MSRFKVYFDGELIKIIEAVNLSAAEQRAEDGITVEWIKE